MVPSQRVEEDDTTGISSYWPDTESERKKRAFLHAEGVSGYRMCEVVFKL